MFRFLRRNRPKSQARTDASPRQAGSGDAAPLQKNERRPEHSEGRSAPAQKIFLQAKGTGLEIDDTFAEAFPMAGTALLITAESASWAMEAARIATGFATSVIGCGAEAGIDREYAPHETPDGRPGVRVLIFSFSVDELQRQIDNRAGQCILTCPSTACFAGLPPTDKPIRLGANMRYFGDGFQSSKVIGGTRYWRVPVMDGEFVCEDLTYATTDAVGGGNLILVGATNEIVLRATEVAVQMIRAVPDAIVPFPGGIARSGSKVGSRYKSMMASTNDAFAPTLRARTASDYRDGEGAALEIVIDGLTSDAVANAMRAGLRALRESEEGSLLSRVTAGNYGGKLGPHHFHLKNLVG